MTQLELRRHAKDLAAAHEARETTKEELDKVQAENAKLKRELERLKKGSSARKSVKKRAAGKRK
jgi:cell division protein FtsB